MLKCSAPANNGIQPDPNNAAFIENLCDHDSSRRAMPSVRRLRFV
jgi:hypothetical protein